MKRPDIEIRDGIAYIPLGGRRGLGLYAMVDEVDVALVAQVKWNLKTAARYRHAGYASCGVRTNGRTSTISMHRLLIPGVAEVDHANGNGLDNRRANLRVATTSQNGANRPARPDNASGFRGVHLQGGRGRWVASIRVAGHLHYLGYFADRRDAAVARDAAARLHFGEFARLNFPLPGERGLSGEIAKEAA